MDVAKGRNRVAYDIGLFLKPAARVHIHRCPAWLHYQRDERPCIGCGDKPRAPIELRVIPVIPQIADRSHIHAGRTGSPIKNNSRPWIEWCSRFDPCSERDGIGFELHAFGQNRVIYAVEIDCIAIFTSNRCSTKIRSENRPVLSENRLIFGRFPRNLIQREIQPEAVARLHIDDHCTRSSLAT